MGRPKGSREKSHIESLDWEKLEEITGNNTLYGYREFCRLLNIPIKSSGSGSQIKQLNELSMVCEYEKTNTKYKFIRMRNQDEIMLYRERSSFTPLIEYCLTEKFLELNEKDDVNIQNGILFFSMGTILSWCGIVHENFEYVRKSRKQPEHKIAIAYKHQFDLQEMTRFVDISYEKILKPMVRNALRAMDNKKSIVIHKGFRLYKKSGDGRIYKNILGTSSLGRQIEKIISDTYTEFNIRNAQDLFFAKKEIQQQVYDRYNELCRERLDYDGFFDCYAIVVNRTRSQHNLEVLRHEINARIQTKMDASPHLKSLPSGSKDKFIGMMIDLNTEVNFREDVDEYNRIALKR